MKKTNHLILKLTVLIILTLNSVQQISAQTFSTKPVIVSHLKTANLNSLTVPDNLKQNKYKSVDKMVKPIIVSQFVKELNGTVTVAFDDNQGITNVWVSKDVNISKNVLLQNNIKFLNTSDCESLSDWRFYKCRFKEIVTVITP